MAWPVELVLMATPAGQRAWTTVPSVLTMSTTGQTPPGTHGMPLHR